MFNDDNGTGAGNLLTLLFGIAIGVAGTLVYAAVNEEQFGQAVRKTKQLKGSAQNSINDYVDDATSKVKSLSDKAQDTYDDVVSKVKGKATDVADTVETKAKQAKSEINS